MVNNMKNKEKYNMSHLHIIERESETKLFMGLNHVEIECDGKIVKEYVCVKGSEIRCFLEWMEEEYKPEILTDKEKAYLSAVVKPFREKVESIKKFENYYSAQEYIHIAMKKGTDYCSLPWFRKGTMYKGMEAYKLYTLEDLGL